MVAFFEPLLREFRDPRIPMADQLREGFAGATGAPAAPSPAVATIIVSIFLAVLGILLIVGFYIASRRSPAAIFAIFAAISALYAISQLALAFAERPDVPLATFAYEYGASLIMLVASVFVLGYALVGMTKP